MKELNRALEIQFYVGLPKRPFIELVELLELIVEANAHGMQGPWIPKAVCFAVKIYYLFKERRIANK